MKSIILTMAFTAIICFTVNAQNEMPLKTTNDTLQIPKLKFGIGLEEGFPVGYVSKYSSFVTGISLQAAYPVVKNLDITLSAGYLYFLAKDGEEGLSFVPVMAGLRYSFLPKFYLSAQIGASAYSGSDSNRTVYLTYAQGLGYKVSKSIDLMARFESINIQVSRNYSYAGMGIAYTFGRAK